MNVMEMHLVKLSRTGDRAAFMELVNLYKDKMHRLAYRMLNNRQDSEDIVQETFMRVYMNLNHYDETQKFSTWIYRIGKNLCIDLLRKKKATRSLDAAEAGEERSRNYYDRLQSADPSPETRYLHTEFREQVYKVLGKLNEKYRLIIALYYLEEMSLQEISEKLGIPVTTVKSRLHRGREQLRKKWGTTILISAMMFFASLL